LTQLEVNMKKGSIITQEYNMLKIDAGMICVLREQNVLRIVTVQHYSHNDRWVVTGETFTDYEIPLDAMLCKLVIVDEKGTYPLKLNQWKKAIKNKEVNSPQKLSFELIPTIFKTGKSINTCNECTAQFLGGRNQSICQSCCDEDVVARIVISNQLIKPKRPRILTVAKVREIAKASYDRGERYMPKDEFLTWLDKQF